MTARAIAARRLPPGGLGHARDWLEEHPWIWSFMAALLLWIAIGVIAGRGVGGTLTSALRFAPFLILVGIGQMFVITTGYGAIDLSVPFLMTLTAFVGIDVMDHHGVALGLAASLGCGLAVAVANVVAIELFAVPPIVATLAVGLMAQSAGNVRASGFGAQVPDGFQSFVTAEVGPFPLLALLCIAAAGLAGFVLHRTAFGRGVQAIGQNRRAADLAGLRVNRLLASAYLISGLLAGLSGVLLGAQVTPSLDLGDPYLLDSIAVVVLGGSLIQGGRSNVPGVWGGTLFLLLLVTLLGVLDISLAAQNIVKGALIIIVLALASSQSAT